MSKKQRKYYRTHFVFPVRITISAEKEENSFHAFSDNISEGGLKLVLNRKLSQDLPIHLRFDLLDEGDSFTQLETKGKILWEKKQSFNKWEHGIAFSDLSAENWEIIKTFMKKYCVE